MAAYLGSLHTVDAQITLNSDGLNLTYLEPKAWQAESIGNTIKYNGMLGVQAIANQARVGVVCKISMSPQEALHSDQDINSESKEDAGSNFFAANLRYINVDEAFLSCLQVFPLFALISF